MEDCSGFFTAAEEKGTSCLDAFQASGPLQWVTGNILEAFYNTGYVLIHPLEYLIWLPEIGKLTTTEAKVSVTKVIYYGGSTEFFFFVLTTALLVLIAGLIWRPFLWRVTQGIEGFGNIVGRIAAWAGLAMVFTGMRHFRH